IETDVGAVLAAVGLLRAHDDGGHHLALLDRPLWARLLDRGHNYVADGRIAAPGATPDPDHQDFSRAGVVGYAQPCFVLDHGCLLRPLQDLDQSPALGPAQGAAFADEHGVAGLRVVALVVDV